MRLLLCAGMCLSLSNVLAADQAVDLPRATPVTRPEMKQMLEDLKHRSQRVPLPELTDQDREALGERAQSYEARLRYHYLPAQEGSVFGGAPRPRGANGSAGPGSAGGPAAPPPVRDFTRNADENMTLTYQFKTQLFWIVARTNNCQYCLGHQEWKLAETGMSDDAIAALDADWTIYTPAEQAAFRYARRLTWQPQTLADQSLDDVLQFYTPSQVLEMTMSMCWNNAINRWKEGVGVPQSAGNTFARRGGGGAPAAAGHSDSFETPTSEKYRHVASIVVPYEQRNGQPTGRGLTSRASLEPREQVLARLAELHDRQPRLPLADVDATQAWLKEANPELPFANWMRLLAVFPNEGRSRLSSLAAREQQTGELTQLQKLQVNWITARQDRAWYATAQALHSLQTLGQTEAQIFALDGDWHEFSPADQALFRFAQHLAASPIAATDDDARAVLEQTSPRHLVQLVNHVTACAYFNRLTEAAGLPLE